jgi:hypothetical protein
MAHFGCRLLQGNAIGADVFVPIDKKSLVYLLGIFPEISRPENIKETLDREIQSLGRGV